MTRLPRVSSGSGGVTGEFRGHVPNSLVYGSVDASAAINRSVVISSNNLEVMMIIRTELERH